MYYQFLILNAKIIVFSQIIITFAEINIYRDENWSYRSYGQRAATVAASFRQQPCYSREMWHRQGECRHRNNRDDSPSSA